MKQKSVKLIKKNQSAGSELLAKVAFVGSRNKWSKTIRSWIEEFRQRDQHESLPTFDSLFKDELSNTDIGIESWSATALRRKD